MITVSPKLTSLEKDLITLVVFWKQAALILFLLVCLLAGLDCFAEVRVFAVHARGEQSIPEPQARALITRAAAELTSATGVHIRVRHFQSMPNPFQSMQYDLLDGNRSNLLHKWRDWMNARAPRYDTHMAIVPPILYGGSYWLAGYSTGVCARYGTSYANTVEYSTTHQYRIPYAFIAIKHELAHLIGSDHYDYYWPDSNSNPTSQVWYGCNLMDPAAMAYGCTNLIPQSVKAIQRCTGRWN